MPLKDNGSIWSRFTEEDSKRFLFQKEYGELHPSRTVVKDWIVQFMGKKKMTLLDVPCGSGVDCKNLKDICEYTGMDKTPNLVDGTLANFPDVKAIVGDIREMPVADGSYDIVLARAIFEHLPDLEDAKTAIKECFRVAKKACILSFFIVLGENEQIVWNGQYFNNTYKKSDIDEYVASLGAKKVEYKRVDVDGKEFVDAYDIFFIEK